MADNTAKKQRGRPYEPGQSGNPAGRPKGSRNKLGEDFIAAVAKDWTEHGATVIAQVRQSSPVAYLRVVASLVPQHVAITNGEEFADMTDEQLRQAVVGMCEKMGIPEAARAIWTGAVGASKSRSNGRSRGW